MHSGASREVHVLRQLAALQIMGSEVGVVDIPNWDIASKGRLMPGNIFLVDFDAGRVLKDEEVDPPISRGTYLPRLRGRMLKGMLCTQSMQNTGQGIWA